MDAPIDWVSVLLVVGGMMLYLVLLFAEEWYLLRRWSKKPKHLGQERLNHG